MLKGTSVSYTHLDVYKRQEPDPVYIKEKLVKLLADNKDADLYITQGYILSLIHI